MGNSEDLTIASQQCLPADDEYSRVIRSRSDPNKAFDLVQMGELSAAGHALEGDPHCAGKSPNVECAARSGEALSPSQFPRKSSPDPSSITFV